MSSTSPAPPSSSSAPPNATVLAAQAAAAAAEQAEEAERALQQILNQRTAGYFTIAVAGLMFLFIVFHWARYAKRRSPSTEASGLLAIPAATSRFIRFTLNRPCPGFSSLGHAVLIVVYFGINIALTVTNIPTWSGLDGVIAFGKRCGWMAISNMAFITFLALKNTPLAFLSAYSYERLNIFHQVAGYITVIYALLHTTLETFYFYKEDYTSVLVEMAQINGMIATGGMFVIMVTAIILKKMQYEVFYITHIMMYMLILINMGLHRPDFATKTVIITIFAASMWAYDRIFRMLKLLFHFYGNRATLTPLADGTTRVVLSRAPWQAAAGNHCFLWIPSIRLVETHPFTIASVGPHSMEIVVAGHDGFTKELYNFARKHPGASLRASIDGPYGTVPNFAKEADKVVFIAGGSGASFTFGAALHMIHQLGNSAATSIEFIWTVKHQEHLSWYTKELSELQSYARVNISLYITRDSTDSKYNSSAASPNLQKTRSVLSSGSSQTEFEHPRTAPQANSFYAQNAGSDSRKLFDTSSATPEKSPVSSSRPIFKDVEKQSTGSYYTSASSLPLRTISGRPDINTIVRAAVGSARDTDRIAVAACGPQGLMKSVRKVATDCIRLDGPSVELHTEEFGW